MVALSLLFGFVQNLKKPASKIGSKVVKTDKNTIK